MTDEVAVTGALAACDVTDTTEDVGGGGGGPDKVGVAICGGK